MPPWWGRRPKSTNTADANNKSKKDEENPQNPSSIKARKNEKKTKPKSFDEALAAKDSVKNIDGFVFAFDSDGPGTPSSSGRGRRKDLPLPRPSDLSASTSMAALEGGTGSGSGSVSSVSSSEGSSCEAGAEIRSYRIIASVMMSASDLSVSDYFVTLVEDFDWSSLRHVVKDMFSYSDPNTPRGRSGRPDSHRQHVADERPMCSPVSVHTNLRDISVSPRRVSRLNSPELSPRRNGHRASTETFFNLRSKSPVLGSRGRNISMSPIHPRSCSVTPESPLERQGDVKSPQGHPLPLPPNHQTFRNHVVNENGQGLHSRWRKGRLLGRGTFGHVYEGFNSENGQMCAIKEVKDISDDQASKESLKQLNQEIILLSQLAHPNIVQYYGSELTNDTLSVYLEYVSGGSIHKLLQEYGPFREPVIRNYTGQILSGLAYLHGRNTVHRDIKGANILVDPNGEIKLADFGMAKHVIMNGNGYNLAVDIWSLGCTILEMATSKPPWSQYEGVAAIFKIGNSKDIPEIPDHLSNDAKQFLKLCLQRDPSARPTAAELLDHPFVRDQVTLKVPRGFPPSDGSRTLHSDQCEDKPLFASLSMFESSKAIRTVS
ncbi:Mitogen-activated protein kinase kinase kinase YODA [Acorus gramineus]|uniref:mitogen-activated protein kinase kinase kinase n=1 Tax=Acorus gramineus TaxID=55184 RepID=A0AAV9BKW2_ACOGR|nr:Mitogen-activated protein kinase kinase kinase YODA [Acorus gramineus]